MKAVKSGKGQKISATGRLRGEEPNGNDIDKVLGTQLTVITNVVIQLKLNSLFLVFGRNYIVYYSHYHSHCIISLRSLLSRLVGVWRDRLSR